MADEPEVAALQAEIATLSARVKELNGESKGHRLNADNFRRQAEDARTATDAAQQALAEAQTNAAGEMEKLRIDLTGRATAAETAATQATETARNRVMMADLRVAARENGMIDLDGLKLLDLSGAKLDDGGNLTNAADMLGAMKEAKPYFFGQAPKPGTVTGTTASTMTPPKQAPATGFDARKAPPADYATAKREMLAASGTR